MTWLVSYKCLHGHASVVVSGVVCAGGGERGEGVVS